LGHLVFSIQQVASTDSSNSSPTKLINILESLCSRMLKCSLENFGLVCVTSRFMKIFLQKVAGFHFDCGDNTLLTSF
jgi:hypothetical protein